jgi:aspartyl aminopeptidase
MIVGYGQDDRISAYNALMALINNIPEKPKRTMVVYFSDKEEVGSQGSTGAHSIFIRDFISDLLAHNQEDNGCANLRKTFMNSQILSADVSAAIDPNLSQCA